MRNIPNLPIFTRYEMVYRQVGNSWFLTGVVSFGTNACDSSLPGVYTRTSSFLPWLLDTLGTL